MSIIAVKHFDTLAYVKQARKLGASEELAEFQAKQIEHAIEVAISQIENKELATKIDISELKLDLIKWMIGIGFISITTLSGVIFTFLKIIVH